MGMEGYSLSDIRTAVGSNDGMFGGNSIIWLFALLFLFNGNFGGYGCNARGQAATTEDLASGFNFNSLQGKTNDILAAVNNSNQVISNSVCQLGYQNLQSFNALERQIAECCCATQRAVDSVKFDMANYAAATNQLFTAGIQSVKDMFRDYNEQNLRQQNMMYYIQSQLCGVPRYNLGTVYGAVPAQCFGYSGNGCGCCNQ